MNWVCPFCSVTQTIMNPKFHSGVDRLDLRNNSEGPIALKSDAITCSNDECRRTSIAVSMIELGGSWENKTIFIPSEPTVLWTKRLAPESYAKALPDYIPKPLRDDYAEACAIRDLSPKASATISRRCLQGMIRDFCGIAKSRLVDEITMLSEAVSNGSAPRGVSGDSIDAIDALRGIGNIGAHMEKDINAIVEVDANEAQLMIELLETLFDDWYVARSKREQRFKSILAAAQEKKDAKAKPTSSAPAAADAQE
jgi:hypothetical protein